MIASAPDQFMGLSDDDLMTILLQNLSLTGGELNRVDKHGLSGVHNACITGKVEVLHAFLELGASVNIPVSEGHPDVSVLTDPGMSVVTRAGTTALHYAASHGNLEALVLLLFNEADIEARDSDGFTPLHAAAVGGQETAIRILWAEGANMYSKNNAGSTPFDGQHHEGKNLADLLAYLELEKFDPTNTMLSLKNKFLKQYDTISSGMYMELCRKTSRAICSELSIRRNMFSCCSPDPDVVHDGEDTMFLPCTCMVMCGVCIELFKSAQTAKCPKCGVIVDDIVTDIQK